MESQSTNSDLANLLIQKKLRDARNNFWEYRTLMNPNMKKGWWQKEVASELQKFHEDLVEGKKPYLFIEAPPQHGKSEQIIDFVTWCIGKHPDMRSIFASFSDTLGMKANSRIQKIIDSEKFARVFPDVRLPRIGLKDDGVNKKRTQNFLEISRYSGSFRNTTVQGPVTGEGLDLGVIDDPLKGREAANSMTIRNKVWNWFTDDFFTRFSEEAGMLGIMTRWHVDDLVGRMIENGFKIKVLKYPAIATVDEPNRKAGEPLFPELKSLEFLMARKALMLQTSWLSLYQQSPIVHDGEMFEISKFEVVDYPSSNIVKTVRYWDKAGTEGGGARTAGVRMSLLEDGTYLIENCIADQVGAVKREALIKSTAQCDGSSVKVGIEQEPGSGGKESAESTVRNLTGFVTTVDKVSGSKELRAEPYAVQVGHGNVKLLRGEWNRAFIDEHQTFPNGKFKDMVDASSGAFSMLTNSNVGSYGEQHKPRPRKEIKQRW
jgi:predicted phage terminase large subunit-like protein